MLVLLVMFTTPALVFDPLPGRWPRPLPVWWQCEQFTFTATNNFTPAAGTVWNVVPVKRTRLGFMRSTAEATALSGRMVR